MGTPLPKWMMTRYLLLWKKFDTSKFDTAQALDVLQHMPKPDTKSIVALLLSELRKAGWLRTEFNPQDARKRIYTLNNFETVFGETFDEMVLEIKADKMGGVLNEDRTGRT